jgi:signal transduction histidine kinase
VHDERNRIARELHDIVSHNLSVVVVQAAGARALRDRPGHDTDATLEKIESSGRSALGEMRRLLNVLRAGDDEASGGPDLAPIPGIDDLAALAGSVGDAGLVVDLALALRSVDVPATVDVSVFRIVQEALTNTLRHGGPGVSAQVDVRRVNGAVVVTVTDDGRGPGTGAEPGHGLRGMRERVALLGGEFVAGPRPLGGFSVSARLPIGDET